MKKDKSAYSIQGIEYALDVLEQFLGNNTELGVTEVSRRLGLNKNHVFRLLATLVSRNYLQQNKLTNCYRLGIKNVELGQTAIRQIEINQQARPVLEALVRKCNETSDVAIMRGTEVFYLDAVETDHLVRAVSRVANTFPAYCTAAGKVLLAGALDQYLIVNHTADYLRRYTPNTISDREELERQLKEIAVQEYAVEYEELDAGVRAVAAPIRNHSGSVVGAVSIYGPGTRFSSGRLHDELVPLVKRAAEEISLRLGYHFSDGSANREQLFLAVVGDN